MKELKEKLILKEVFDEDELKDQVEKIGLNGLSELIDEYLSCVSENECNRVSRKALHIMQPNKSKIGEGLYKDLLYYFGFYIESLEEENSKDSKESEEKKLPDVVLSEPGVVSSEDEDKGQEVFENSGIAGLINSLILDEFNAVDMYNSAITTLASMENENKDKVIAIINDILNEENIHIGQLQEVLKLVQPSAEKIEDGKDEAQDTLASTEAPIEPKDEIPEDENKKEKKED